jgi:hypothetical protein
MFGLPKEGVCPLLKGECIKARCMFWTHVRGTHPQSGAEIDMPDCAVRYLPVLLIENAKETRQAAATTQEFRNDMVQANQGLSLQEIANQATQKRLANNPLE